MKNTKKFLSMLLVVLMCLTAVPFGGFDLGTVASAADTPCEHPSYAVWKLTCGAQQCLLCLEKFYHDTDEHIWEATVAGIPSVAKNMCEYCRYFDESAAADLKVGNNSIVVDENVAFRYIPSVSGKFKVTLEPEITSASKYMYLNEGYDNKLLENANGVGLDNDCSITYNFTAGEVYLFIFDLGLSSGDEQSYNATVSIVCADDSHTKTDSTPQTCKGYECTTCGEYFGEKASHTKTDSTPQTCKGYKCTTCGTYFGEANDQHSGTGSFCDNCYAYIGKRDLYVGENKINQADLTSPYQYDDTYYNYIRFIPQMTGKYTITPDTQSSSDDFFCGMYDTNLDIIFNNQSSIDVFEGELTQGEEYFFVYVSFSEKTSFTLTITAPTHEHSYSTTVTCMGKKCSICGGYDGTTGGSHTKADNATQTCLGYKCTTCGEYFGEKATTHSLVTTACGGARCTACNTYIDYDNTAHTDGTDYFNDICDKCYKYLGTKELYVGSNAITGEYMSVYGYKMIRFVPKITGEYTISGDILYSNNDQWLMIDEEVIKTLGTPIAMNRNSDIVKVSLTAGKEYFFIFYSGTGKTDLTFIITAPTHEHSYSTTVTCLGKYCSVCGGYDGTTGGSHTKADNATQTCLGYKCTTCGEYFGEKATTHSFATTACGGARCTVCKTYVDYDDTAHTDGDDYFDNICDKCYKYLGTKELYVGTNAITEDYMTVDRYNMIRFVPTISGEHTISGDILYSNNDQWLMIDEEVAKNVTTSMPLATNVYSDIVKVNLTAGKEYFFAFYSGTGKTDLTFIITAPVPPHTHEFTDVAYKAATCTEPGNNAHKYCSACNKYFDVDAATDSTNGADTNEAYIIAATGHTFTDVPYKAAKCTEPGNEAHKYCSVCNKYFDTTAATNATNGANDNSAYIISATGHNFNDTVTGYAPDCCNDGIDSYKTCSNCYKYFAANADEFSLDGEESDVAFIQTAIGHNFGDIVEVKPATCTEDGVKIAYKYCDKCGLYYDASARDTEIFGQGTENPSRFIQNATGHSFTDVPYKAAKCTEPGNEAHKYCSACELYFDTTAEKFDTNGADDNSAYVITATGHDFTGTVKMDADGKDGTHSFACANGCGEYGKVVAHTWDAGEVTTPATHLEEGVKTYTCTCGATYTEPVAKIADHNHVAGTPVEPTCTEQGYTVYTCECGDSYKADYVDALGHNYVDGTCDSCGEAKPSDCDCMCHQNTIVKFIYMILDFVLTLMGSDFDCRCGESHF